jgi:hypothetical protein
MSSPTYKLKQARMELALATFAIALCVAASAQQDSGLRQATAAPQKDAKAIIAAAAQTELDSDRNDHTAYQYLDHDMADGHDTLVYVVETPRGNLRKKLEDHGKPLTPEGRFADEAKIQTLLNDQTLQHKQQEASSHDDNQAEQLLKILPTAFLWTIASEQGDLITLDFKPDPGYQPPNMEARVFGAMAGQVIVARGDNRIRTMRGKMINDVKIFGGILGGLHKGGTFQVERREVASHHWQVTELHVHIAGKVFFATIGSQEDEWRTDFKPSTAKNLQDAYDIVSKLP